MKKENLLNCNGRRFRAKIDGIKCEGVISIAHEMVYLCQNFKRGAEIENKYGYDFSWRYTYPNDVLDSLVTDFELLKEGVSFTLTGEPEDIKKAIKLLKDNGYKVLKQDWIEL